MNILHTRSRKKLKHCALHVEVIKFQPDRMPLTYGNNCNVFSLTLENSSKIFKTFEISNADILVSGTIYSVT